MSANNQGRLDFGEHNGIPVLAYEEDGEYLDVQLQNGWKFKGVLKPKGWDRKDKKTLTMTRFPND